MNEGGFGCVVGCTITIMQNKLSLLASCCLINLAAFTAPAAEPGFTSLFNGKLYSLPGGADYINLFWSKDAYTDAGLAPDEEVCT